MLPLRQLIELPPRPFALGAFSIIAGLLTIAVAVLGVGHRAGRDGNLRAGVVRVENIDVTQGRAVPLDLRKKVRIRLTQKVPNAVDAQIAVTVANVAIATSTIEPLGQADGGLGADVDMRPSRYLAAGNVTAELRLLANGGDTVAHQQFSARLAQPPYLTVAGLVIVALLVILLTSAESLLRQLGHSALRSSSIVGLLFTGLALGIVMVAVRWLLAGPEPTKATVTITMAGGVGAALAATMAAARIGRRARIRPRMPATARDNAAP